MNCVIKGQFYKGLINWSFSYNSFVKFHGIKHLGECCIQIHVIRSVIKGLLYVLC